MARFPTRYNNSGIHTLNEVATAEYGSDWPHKYGTDPYYQNVACHFRSGGFDYDYFFPSYYYEFDSVGANHNAITFINTSSVYASNFTPWSKDKYNWSVEFSSGTAGGEYYTIADNASLQFGTGDFTIDFYINMLYKTGYQTIMAKGYTGTGQWLVQTGNGNGNIVFFNGSTAIATESGTTVNYGQWYRITITRSGTDVTIYRDGVQVATGTSSVDLNANNTLGIGNSPLTTTYYVPNSKLSNVRLIKGEAVVPSTDNNEPLPITDNTVLHTCSTKRHEDTSIYEHDITLSGTGLMQVVGESPFPNKDEWHRWKQGWSKYIFTGGKIYTTSTDIMDFGTDDFTIEFWYYNGGDTVSSSYNTIVSSYDGDNSESALRIYANGGVSKQLLIQVNSSGTNLFAIPNAWEPFEWNHFALVRSSGVSKVYKNGKEIASTTDTNNYVNGGSGFAIGDDMYSTNVYGADGFLADVHVVKNFAVYTSDFDIDSYNGTRLGYRPVSNDNDIYIGLYNGTRFLMAGFQYGADVSGNCWYDMFGTASPYVSMDSDNTKFGLENNLLIQNGYLYTRSNTSNSFVLPNDFTFDGWVYANSISGNGIFHSNPGNISNSTTGVALLISTASGFPWTVYFDGTIYTTTTYPSVDTWYHFALVRNGDTLTLYIDGTSIWSITGASGTIGTTTMFVGCAYNTGFTWDGNLEDFRFTNNVARYTGNFTPPTTLQPVQGGVA